VSAGGSTWQVPWRSNVEAFTMAIVMAVLFKGFVVDVYKIPTGSMQPTLIGDERSGIYDRILVDSLSYTFRDPERWEVAVFRFPLDRSKHYVKRVVGIGPEELRIRGGDVWHRADSSLPWQVLRRPRAVQDTVLKPLDLEPQGPTWEASGEWEASGRSLRARGSGDARYVPRLGEIRDDYLDGYPVALRGRVRPRPDRSGANLVGDLRVSGSVQPLSGTSEVTIELTEGGRSYRFHLPGPAALEGAAPSIEVFGSSRTPRSATAAPARLSASHPTRFVVQNVDDLLELSLDGRWVASLEVDPATDARSGARLAIEGPGADFDDLMVHRDVHYTTDLAKEGEFSVPAGHYFMLGDNTQDSSDSRDWILTRFRFHPTEGESYVVSGDTRRGENPRNVNYAQAEGPMTFFRDEWGEEHWLPAHQTERITPITSPYVPREMIEGRALAVFWPMNPLTGVYRLRWIR